MKQKLLKEYKYKTELHSHTLPISLCSEVYAEKLIEIYKKRNADSIVLTNHFTWEFVSSCSKDEAVKKYIESFYDFKKCAKKNGISAILGMELRFTENINDYLIYGIEEDDIAKICDYIPKGLDCFYREFKNEKNLIYQAHPFRDNMVQVNPENIDGIEVFNMHPKTNSRVALAAAYAKEHHLPISGGTDFHIIGHEGCCFIRTKSKLETSYDVAEVLKKQDFVLDIFENIILP